MKRSLPHADTSKFHRVPAGKAMVLLSGLDSAVAMHWARENFPEVAAVSFRYGQAHADAEVAASQLIAERRCVPWTVLDLAEAVRGVTELATPTPGLVRPGVSRANLPARNTILLSVAAAHAARIWPGEYITLVIGANMDDARGFPDCRAEFIQAAAYALTYALVGVAEMWVRAPWVEQAFDKAAIVRWASTRPDALEDARASVSCYRGTTCGACDACALRVHAFEAAGLDDTGAR